MAAFHPFILLMEGDPDFIYLFERYAQQGGWRMVTCSTGQEVVTLARQLQPDVIFINLRLPVSDGGWSVFQALKKDAETLSIPVVVYSSKPETDRAKQEGADISLCKPILYEDVLTIVKRLGSQSAISTQGGLQ